MFVVIWEQVTEFEAGIIAREAHSLSPMSLRSSSSLRRTDRYRLVERVFRHSTSSLSTLRPPFFRVFPVPPVTPFFPEVRAAVTLAAAVNEGLYRARL